MRLLRPIYFPWRQPFRCPRIRHHSELLNDAGRETTFRQQTSIRYRTSSSPKRYRNRQEVWISFCGIQVWMTMWDCISKSTASGVLFPSRPVSVASSLRMSFIGGIPQRRKCPHACQNAISPQFCSTCRRRTRVWWISWKQSRSTNTHKWLLGRQLRGKTEEEPSRKSAVSHQSLEYVRAFERQFTAHQQLGGRLASVLPADSRLPASFSIQDHRSLSQGAGSCRDHDWWRLWSSNFYIAL